MPLMLSYLPCFRRGPLLLPVPPVGVGQCPRRGSLHHQRWSVVRTEPEDTGLEQGQAGGAHTMDPQHGLIQV